jgi:catechol 2,3-dioxygenase-like lactoylglutathione lyase family enzyme
MTRPRPLKLGHLVLKVRDIDASLAFYEDVVGLEVSDWIDDRMVFLRAGRDHHDLALLQMTPEEIARHVPGASPVEHFSYHLESVEQMEEAVAKIQALGIMIDRGLGKHGPGGNTFLVFRDPDGNNVEFYSDMIQVGDGAPPHVPRVWAGSELGTFDQWGLKRFVVEPPERIKKQLSNLDANKKE